MSRQPRGIAGAAIVFFWLVMMALLAWREWGDTAAAPPLTAAERLAAPRDVWLGIFAEPGNRIGFMNLRAAPGARGGRDGAQLNLLAELRTNILGMETAFDLTGQGWVSPEAGLEYFDVHLNSGPHTIRFEGETREGALRARLHTGGEVMPLSLPLQGQGLLGAAGFSGLDTPRLEPGDSIEMEAFNPVTFTPGTAVLTCTGRETLEAGGQSLDTRIIVTEIGGVSTRAWVDEDDELVRAETPFGFILERIAPEEALAPSAPLRLAESLGSFSVRPNGPTPERGAARMRFSIAGAPPEAMPPEDDFQRRDGEGYLITRPTAPEGPDTVPGEDMTPYLESDPFVTAAHPRIQEAARSAVGDAATDWEKALRLHDWVFENVAKVPAISVPAALDVLDTMHGDCNEHTVLFTALARAEGIPARIAIGLVWSGELEAFGYHAWPEVHLSGRWIPMDPTLGQPLADATHIKLLNGGIGEWGRLLTFLGKLRITVTDV